MNNSNSLARGLGNLQSAYLTCVNEQMTQFLAKPPQNPAVQEWCLKEKEAYYNYMKENYKTEYDNLHSLDLNRF